MPQHRGDKQRREEAFNLAGLPGMREALGQYASGSGEDAGALARTIITALFQRDFMPGRHWVINGATAQPVGADAVFACEKTAEWDWKDVNAVASATARITVTPALIRIDEYSYYVAG